MMSGEKTRVDFNAPSSLVDEADNLAELLDISRTQLLINALRDEIEDLATDEQVRRELKAAFYDGRVEVDVVESILGTEEAMRMNLLRDALDREPPEPRLDGELPSTEEFYEGSLPEWTPDRSSAGDEDKPEPRP